MLTTPHGSMSSAWTLRSQWGSARLRGDDVELAWAEPHVAVSELDDEFSRRPRGTVLSVSDGLPDELAFDLDHFDLVVVEPGDDFGAQCR